MSLSLSSEVDIFDSNVWVHGLTRRSEDAVSCIDSIFDRERCVLVTPYIYEEVDQAIQRDVKNASRVDELRNRFAEIMSNPFIRDPSYEEVAKVNLEDVRNHPAVTAYAEAIEIQPKDIPILQAAQNCDNPEPTIFTNDDDFYNLSERKERYNLGNIQFEYVEYPRS